MCNYRMQYDTELYSQNMSSFNFSIETSHPHILFISQPPEPENVRRLAETSFLSISSLFK